MIGRSVRLIGGILLIPLVIGYAVAFSESMFGIHRVNGPGIFFHCGVTAYLFFHVFFVPPHRAYVFGHELMHAAATWVSGGQVKGFHAGGKKGSVVTNKVTAFIALAPYLIPIYSILLALIYGILGFFVEMTPWTPWFFFGLGATLTFHLAFTVMALKEKQTDLEVTGSAIALAFIAWTNLFFIIVVMSLATPEVQLWPYLTKGFHHSHGIYLGIFRQLFSV